MALSGGASLLIFLMNVLSFLRRLVAAFFVSFLFRVIRAIAHFIFYKIAVKAYQSYFSMVKRLGWSGFRNSPVLFLVRQKLAHIAVFVITMLLVSNNLAVKAKGEGTADIAGKTILSSLVESEFSTSEEERLIEEFFDEEPIISPTQEKYLQNLSAMKTEPILNTRGEAAAADEEEDGGLPTNGDGTALVKRDVVTTAKTKRPREDVVYYEVQQGDVIGKIARLFDLNVSTILWENNLTAYSIIRPGDKLAILPMDGLTYKVARGDSLDKIANRYNIDKERIVEANKLESSKGLLAGQKILVPGARKTVPATTQVASRPSYSGLQVIKELIKPAPSASKAAAGKLSWPTVGYRITQYYSWRHHGLDIANKTGTPLYAVEDGVVEVAGWGTGYGNTVLINNGNGIKTRYGHLSRFYVKKGDEVERGEVIGLMGSTGWSTGPHLHFEVIINGVKYNPLNYLSR